MINSRLTPKNIWRMSDMSDKKSKKYIPYTKFIEIFNTISIEIENMLLEGKTVYLPHRMGNIRLRKFRPDKLLPDWQATKKLWLANEQMKKERFLVLQNNKHTSGWRVKLTWSKFNCNWKHQGLIVCKRTRGFERRTAWLLKTDSMLIEKIKD